MHEEDTTEEREEFFEKCCQITFAILWADWGNDSQDDKITMSGQDVFDVAPEYINHMKSDEQEQLKNYVKECIGNFEETNGEDIFTLYQYALKLDDQNIYEPDELSTIEMFAYYVIMAMLGYGSSWHDDHEDPHFEYPAFEVTHYSFPNSFPDESENSSDWNGDDDYENFDW